jgi:hypothetical protein
MIYYRRMTRITPAPIITLTISLFIALSCAAVTYTARTFGSNNSTTASLFPANHPHPAGRGGPHEVGSTDGIVVMGGVIVLIVLVPILLQYKTWMHGT